MEKSSKTRILWLIRSSHISFQSDNLSVEELSMYLNDLFLYIHATEIYS